MKVALQFDEPWDFTEDLAGKWWRGCLADEWVDLDEPFQFRGNEHRRVKVRPRYVGCEVSRLAVDETMIVNQTVASPEGEQLLTGSLKRIA